MTFVLCAPCVYSPRPAPPSPLIHARRAVRYVLKSKLYYNFQGGVISVLSTRLALFFGTGAVGLQQVRKRFWLSGAVGSIRTVRVLGDIEFTKDHDRFVSQIPSISLVSWVFRMHDPDFLVLQKARGTMVKGEEEELLLVYTQNASATPELPVLASVVDLADAELPEGGGAHDAWLDGHVEDRIFEKVWVTRNGVVLWGQGWVRKDIIDCF